MKNYNIYQIFLNSLIEPYYEICKYCNRSIPSGKKTCPYCKNEEKNINSKNKKSSQIDMIK
jgi:hypothetical protein